MPLDVNKLIGKTLDNYRIIEHIASGGMADVYKAIDISNNDEVAIKILPPEYARDAEMVSRFQHEAKASIGLNHPNIVKTYSTGTSQGVHYFAMEYISGRSLKDVLAESSALLPHRVLNITTQICHALNYAHSKGLIHRDVKPANIMLDEDDNIILTDFGIARITDSTRLTSTGSSMGTPEYMSPEQIQGDVDERTDIYSLGIVMYEMLTGRVPFQADTPVAVAYKQVHEPLVKPRKIAPATPSELELIILKALEKEPYLRYQSMQAMYNELPKEIRSSVAPKRKPEKIEKEEAKIKSAVGLITVLVLIALGILGVVSYFHLLTGFVEVDSIPNGANVKIDGKSIGTTPIVKRVLIGHHEIELHKQNYGTTDTSVKVKSRENSDLKLKLPASIRSSPSDAEVYINGKYVGQTPLSKHLQSGMRIKIVKDGFLEEERIIISNSTNPVKPVNLRRMYKILFNSEPSGGKIYIHGKSVGVTPKEIELAEGYYKEDILLRKDGFHDHEVRISVGPKSNKEYNAKLVRKKTYGKISVNAMPFGTVYLDGKKLGDTPISKNNVSTGKHKIIVKRDGFEDIEKTVQVKTNENYSIGIKADEWVKAK